MVGNSIGEQALIDLRNKKCLGKLRGGAGSIRCIQCHPTKPLVASCGLDRYVRIHDTNSRALLHKVRMLTLDDLESSEWIKTKCWMMDMI